MTTIGYATLQIIPSLDGVSAAVDRQLGGAMKVAGTKGGKVLGQAVAGGIKAGEADVKRALDSYSKLYDKQADAAGKLKVAKQALKDLDDKGITSGARYTRAVEAQEKAQRDHNRALRDAKGAFSDYEQSAKNAAKAVDDIGNRGGGLFDKLKGAGGSARGAGGEAAAGFVDGFGGPIAAIGSKAGPVGVALAAAAGLGLAAGGLLATQVMAGLNNQAAADQVQARFGLDEATMTKLGDAGGKAYAANFGESIQGNIEAGAVALQNGLLPKDATEQQTQDVVQSLSTVATVLGVEIPEAARSAGQLMKTGFATDFKSAADLIVAGSQSGLNISQDWLDTVNEYSVQFSKLGIDGPEALGLLSQAVQGGARDTDVAADALKEFSIRAVDGSKTTVDGFTKLGFSADDMAAKFAAGGPAAHDALGQVLDGLRSIADPAERSRVAVELFGTQAEDLGGALQNFDLSTAAQQLNEVSGAAQRASDTLGNNVSGGVESARRSVELAATSMQDSLATAFGPTLEKGVSWLNEHQDDVVRFFELGANGAVKLVGAITGMAGDILVVLGNLDAAVGDAMGFVVDAFEGMAGAAATVASALGQDKLAGTLRAAKDELGGISDSLHGAGENIIATGHGLAGFGTDLQHVTDGLGSTKTQAQLAAESVQHVQTALAGLPGGKDIDINAIVTYKDTAGLVISPDQLKTPTFTPAVPGEARRPLGGGRAAGGPISGPGGPTSDIIPIWASNGEHMWTANEVDAVGGQAAMYRLRAMALAGAFGKFAEGGAVGPDVSAAEKYIGHPYSQASRFDCSGTVARVINDALGQSGGGLMSTKNAREWLAARGFVEGKGGPGSISVGWYDHGPNPNDGHMAMTLSDGRPAESGGSHGGFLVGAGAKGADSPQFDQHMYLPLAYTGQGPAGPASASAADSPFAGGSAAAAILGDNSGGGGGSAPAPSASSGSTSSGSGGGFSLPSSFGDLASFGLKDLGKGVGTTKSGSDLSLFGNAAASAVSGQIDSALGVLGVDGSPGWLKAASTLIGGIKVGGGDGASAAPLSATSNLSGAPTPDDPGNMHGARAGQQPGPTYNIYARDTEDSFVRANRIEREKSAAKLSRF